MSRGFHRAPFDPGTLMYSLLPNVGRLCAVNSAWSYQSASGPLPLWVSLNPAANSRVRLPRQSGVCQRRAGWAESAEHIKENSQDSRQKYCGTWMSHKMWAVKGWINLPEGHEAKMLGGSPLWKTSLVLGRNLNLKKGFFLLVIILWHLQFNLLPHVGNHCPKLHQWLDPQCVSNLEKSPCLGTFTVHLSAERRGRGLLMRNHTWTDLSGASQEQRNHQTQ